MSQRQCGECTACCTALPVVELHKPRHVSCPQLCRHGCAIYSSPTKPKICADFECEWLRGNVEQENRPDMLGVIFWFGGPVVAPDGSLMKQVLRVSETCPGAIAKHQQQIDGIVQQIRQSQYEKTGEIVSVLVCPFEPGETGLPGSGFEDQLEGRDGYYILRRVRIKNEPSAALATRRLPDSLREVLCGRFVAGAGFTSNPAK